MPTQRRPSGYLFVPCFGSSFVSVLLLLLLLSPLPTLCTEAPQQALHGSFAPISSSPTEMPKNSTLVPIKCADYDQIRCGDERCSWDMVLMRCEELFNGIILPDLQNGTEKNESLKEEIDSTAVVVSANFGLLIAASIASSGTMGWTVMIAPRLSIVTADCGRVPPLLHPFRLETDGSDEVGILFGTLGVGLVVAAVWGVMGLAIQQITPGWHSYHRGVKGVALQGWIDAAFAPSVLFLFFFQGLALAGFSLLFHPDGAFHNVLGLVGLLTALLPPVVVAYLLWVDLRNLCSVVVAKERVGHPISIFLGNAEWVNKVPNRMFAQRYSRFVRSFRSPQAVCFFLVEFFLSTALCAVHALTPDRHDPHGCGKIKFSMTILFILYGVSVLLFSPFLKARDTASTLLYTTLQMVASILTAASFFERSESLLSRTAVLVDITSVLLILGAIIDVCCDMYVIHSGSRVVLQTAEYTSFQQEILQKKGSRRAHTWTVPNEEREHAVESTSGCSVSVSAEDPSLGDTMMSRLQMTTSDLDESMQPLIEQRLRAGSETRSFKHNQVSRRERERAATFTMPVAASVGSASLGSSGALDAYVPPRRRPANVQSLERDLMIPTSLQPKGRGGAGLNSPNSPERFQSFSATTSPLARSRSQFASNAEAVQLPAGLVLRGGGGGGGALTPTASPLAAASPFAAISPVATPMNGEEWGYMPEFGELVLSPKVGGGGGGGDGGAEGEGVSAMPSVTSMRESDRSMRRARRGVVTSPVIAV